MVIEVPNVTLNLNHLFNNNVTILQSEKNPSQSHQSETQKNQCYLLLYINWLKPKTQQACKEKCWMNWFWDRKRKAYEGIGLNILVEMGFERRVACACELHGPLSFNGGFSIFVLGLWAFHKFYKSCFGPQNI